MTALASEVISTLWPRGIQRVQSYDESLEFKLKGNPFSYSQDDDKVAIRVVLMGILNAFAKEGWIVLPAGRVVRMGDYRSYGIGGESFPPLLPPPLNEEKMLIEMYNAQTA